MPKPTKIKVHRLAEMSRAMNPVPPAFSRFIQAQREMERSEDVDDLLGAYLFHRIRHQMEEGGEFAALFDAIAFERAKAMLPRLPARTSGMSDDEYQRRVLKALVEAGRYNRFHVVLDGQVVGPARGFPTMKSAYDSMEGEQMDLFGAGHRVMSARGVVLRQLGIEE